jgi:signal transduction histidine kinase
MKLFVKYGRINFVAVLAVLFIGSIAYYYIIRYVLIHQLDDTLKVEEQEILDFVQKKEKLPEPSHYRDQSVYFTETDQEIRRKFSSVKLNGHFRQIQFSVFASGRRFIATVSKSQEEADDLIGLIVLITAFILMLLFLVLFFVNRLLLRKLWRPFYTTLGSIKEFNLSSQRSISAFETDIDEFKELGQTVKEMTGKILKDYDTLKNFADNASHEMQTPLAIINSRLDLLIQDQRLDENQMKQLQGIYDATGRLTKLNQSLLLLTKIENNQFAEAKSVRLDTLIREKLFQLEELILSKHLQTNLDDGPTSVMINDYLADILINNLLTNAIRHNQENGQINISIHPGKLVISNSSTPLDFDPSGIFDRFQKSDQSQGIGLGLAIVKQICDNYHFRIEYAYLVGLHSFTILF